MKSILAVAALFAMLSLCNLTDKTKPTANSNASNTNSAEKQSNAESDHRGESSSSPSQPNSNSTSDRAAVTVELMKIEYQVTTASFAGDISTLASNVADDYVGTSADGSTQNKNQLLAATKPDKITKSWKISDGELVSFG